MESEIRWKTVILVLITVVVASGLAWIFRVETAKHPPPVEPPAVSREAVPPSPRPTPGWMHAGSTVHEVSCSYYFAEDDPNRAFDGLISYDSTPPRNRWATWDSRYGRDWIAWRFEAERALEEVVVHFFDDGRGTRLPAAFHLETLDGEEWVEIPVLTRDPLEPTAGQPNRILFEPVTASTFRLVVDHATGHSSGITEIEFSSGQGE